MVLTIEQRDVAIDLNQPAPRCHNEFAELLYSGVNGKPLFSTVAGMIVSMALAEVSLLSAISIELPHDGI